MPPRITLSGLPDGLVFVTEIAVDNIPAVKAKLASIGRPVPTPLKVKALIDTGATLCSTTKEIIDKLRLPAQSKQKFPVSTAGGKIESLRYHGAIAFMSEPAIKADLITIHETVIDEDTPFEFVIGMTALSRWNFFYSRAEQKLTIEA